MNNNNESYYLGSRLVTNMPWIGSSKSQPWPNNYMRVAIPYTEKEKRHAHNGRKFHTQLVRQGKLQKAKQRGSLALIGG